MASETIASASKQRGFLAHPSYLRLWFAGGIGNAVRWLELLVAGIFTYEVTHSTVLVALVIVASSLPILLIGTIAGVVGEALNRKRLLVTQLFVLAMSSAVLSVLAFSGQIRAWHVALGGLVAGIVWAMELAVRRRMIGEVVAFDQIGPAVAFDSLTNSIARVLGPLAAAEPVGAIATGIALSAGWLRLNGSRALLRGSLLFLVGLMAMAVSPFYSLAFVLLLIGGFGTAAFSNMQTTLILTEAPFATRSRVMGIVTMCIGTGAVGVMMIGILSGQIGPRAAILIMAGLGISGLSLVWRKLIKVQAGR